MPEEAQSLTIDSGRDTTKAGFAGERNPRAIFSSAVSTTPPIDSGSGSIIGSRLES